MFDELLRRHDVSRTAALVYGAVALFEHEGHAPNVDDVAVRIGICKRSAQRELHLLAVLRLVVCQRGGGRQRRTRFATAGPKYVCCAA